MQEATHFKFVMFFLGAIALSPCLVGCDTPQYPQARHRSGAFIDGGAGAFFGSMKGNGGATFINPPADRAITIASVQGDVTLSHVVLVVLFKGARGRRPPPKMRYIFPQEV